MKMRAAAMAACLVGTGNYARAYDYVDSRGYRHWCQLSCERLGVRVPKAGAVKPREGKVVDENDLAWEPPTGIKWQVVPEKPMRADTRLFKPSAVAEQDTRP
jgi:hypothetical protein